MSRLRTCILALTLTSSLSFGAPQEDFDRMIPSDSVPDGGPPSDVVYGEDLDGDLQSRLQAVAFGVGEFETTSGIVTIWRTDDDSWIQVDRGTGSFLHVNPDCSIDGSGTITAAWNGDELNITLVGQMCSLDGNLGDVDGTITLTVGPSPGEVEFGFVGSTDDFVRNVGRILIETDAYGSWVRPADQAIHPLGEWDDLIGMAAVMVAELHGDEIRHPSFEEPPPLPPPPSPRQDEECENPGPYYDECMAECDADYSLAVQQAEFALAQAEADLEEVKTDAWADYNEAVR